MTVVNEADPARAATRARVVVAARDWLGTPYRHQASAKGAGADCLGLVRGVYRELYGNEPERVPAYTPDWAEADRTETLLRAARRVLTPIDVDEARAGDVLLFRIVRGGPAKHMAILTEPGRMIHAYAGRAACESYLAPWWRARLVAAFSFPGVI